MRKSYGFSLLEILIAMSVAATFMSFIIMSMRSSFRFVAIGDENIKINEQAFLLINQMERDFSSVTIFSFDTTSTSTKEEKVTLDRKEAPNKFFQAQTQEDDTLNSLRKAKGKLFKTASFVSTSPLQNIEENKFYLVRVGYELKLNKTAGDREKHSYDLIRRETKKLDNVLLKEADSITRKSSKDFIYSDLVAKNIKEISLQFFKKLKKQDQKTGKSKKEIYKSFEWDGGEKTKDQIPDFLKYHIVFWSENKNKEFVFDGLINFFNKKVTQQQPKRVRQDQGEKQNVSQQGGQAPQQSVNQPNQSPVT
ncbi:TPA: hypothetical protein DEO28_04055 [Candidatus Dependentiae bacterium]|nr:MAG: hypothetical protein UR14_C0006G0048 [candidate division TM6 bacterium GW2011_GWE2_31_21]KKP53529.1 MAG: hypothetical protein UR43_C0004G0070 [candidate division TM6 bacterium GW2011_GWF2_33_332]HBS48230.1 hypothetical protein [Candidatus Dependentiae bacterium]HBZ73656.1 hypothetical protein [Candidatus Dependentiae bacterium]